MTTTTTTTTRATTTTTTATRAWDRDAFNDALALLTDVRANAAVAAAGVLRALSIGFRYASAKSLADVADAANAAVAAAPKTEKAAWTRAILALAGGVEKDAKGTYLVDAEASIIEKDKASVALSRRAVEPEWIAAARCRAADYGAYLEAAAGYAGALKIRAPRSGSKCLDAATAGRRICSIIEQLAAHEPLRRELLASLESCGLPLPGKLAG